MSSEFWRAIGSNQTRPASLRDLLGGRWCYDLIGGRGLFYAPADVDPYAHLRHDGWWIANLPVAEQVERDGYTVPAYEGDVERLAYLARVPRIYRRPRWLLEHGVSMYVAHWSVIEVVESLGWGVTWLERSP